MTSRATSLSPEPGRSQIPHGVQDRFLVEAARRRQAEAAVRECFVRWGYQEVIPPTFEYYENLTQDDKDELTAASQSGGKEAVIAVLKGWSESHSNETTKQKALNAYSKLA